MSTDTLPQIPHFDQYFGLWSIEEEALRVAVEQLDGLDLHSHLALAQVAPAKRGGYSSAAYATVDGVAILEVSGPLLKYGSSLGGTTSTVELRRQVRTAASDPNVAAILLRIDSPGGTVAGLYDLTDDIAAAGKEKPVHAYIEDLCASAAYAIASQAATISAGRTALVGSVGTFSTLRDTSKAAGRVGLKVHVVRAGQFKGAGVAGTEIGDDILDEKQRLVDEANQFFLQAVAKGRRLPMPKVEQLADGRVHHAEDAKRLGLIDDIATFDGVLGVVSHSSSNGKEISMSTVTAAEIKAQCPGAPDSFIVEALESGDGIQTIQASWMKLLADENEQLRQKTPGVDPVGTRGKSGAGGTGDARAEWNRLVSEKVAAGMNRQRAVARVDAENPGLREQMLDAHNAAHGRPCEVA